MFAHEIRNNQTKLHKRLVGTQFSDDDFDAELASILRKICNKASKFFQLLTGDHIVGASIRLAALDPCPSTENNETAGKASIVFKTVARSDEYHSDRGETSEALSINQGIAGFFRRKNFKGVLIYNDLQKAAELHAFELLENHRRYPDEIVTMMVSPLNAWDGEKQTVIGLMFITSRRKNIFQIHHVDSLLFMSDIIAITIAHWVAYAKLKSRSLS